MNKKPNKYLSGNLILKQTEELGALVLGDCNSAVDLSIIKANKIRTIISIGMESLPEKSKISEEILHRFYDIHDNKQQKIPVELLDQVVQVIHQNRKRGGVLVHCYAGVSRSSSFVIAYVMSTYKLEYDDAKEKVKKHRTCIHPGDGFVRQLQFYAKVLAKRQEQRLQALRKKDQPPPEKQKEEPQLKQANNQSTPSERIRRGVRGAVRSAQVFSPEKVKSSIGPAENFQITIQQKIQQKKDQQETKSIKFQQKQQKSDKLPRIPLKYEPKYDRTSSLIDIKRNIDKIQGKTAKLNISSLRGVYGGKMKIK